ncbi:MAG: hypothetical protein PWQ97_665 [Tepidanaerobacteraceae bacterium]|nr:hypothetical protein [Tepidanaerobacteraceae bacterium]
MHIVGFAVVMGAALVVFYLFLRKLFNEDRLIFPKKKPRPGEKPHGNADKTPSEEAPEVSKKARPEPDEKPGESVEKKDEQEGAAEEDKEKESQQCSPANVDEIKM